MNAKGGMRCVSGGCRLDRKGNDNLQVGVVIDSTEEKVQIFNNYLRFPRFWYVNGRVQGLIHSSGLLCMFT